MIDCEECLNFSYFHRSLLIGLCHEKKRWGKPMVLDLTKKKRSCSCFERINF